MADLHPWLVYDHGYAVQPSLVAALLPAHYPVPPKRARRRVETPSGAQVQVDWATFPAMTVSGQQTTLEAFHMALSHSRFPAVIWALRQDQLNWLGCHNEAFTRLGGSRHRVNHSLSEHSWKPSPFGGRTLPASRKLS